MARPASGLAGPGLAGPGLAGLAALLLAGPVLFLTGIVVVSVALGASGTPPDRIAAEVPRHAPVILLAALAALGLLAAWRLPVRALWAAGGMGRWRTDAMLGAIVGAVLAAAYLSALAPAMAALQARVGDYVPPGAVLATVSGQAAVFFVANVLLAPVVEETVYRGAGLRGLGQRLGMPAAVVLSCAAFGLLHWTGGIWYMALTGIVAGGAFTALALLRGGLVAPFAAHLVLNLIEFVATL